MSTWPRCRRATSSALRDADLQHPPAAEARSSASPGAENVRELRRERGGRNAARRRRLRQCHDAGLCLAGRPRAGRACGADRAIELNGVAFHENARPSRSAVAPAPIPRRFTALLRSPAASRSPRSRRSTSCSPGARRSLPPIRTRPMRGATAPRSTGCAGGGRAGGEALAEAVARSLFKLMAYKDEYEVARLHTDPAFHADIARRFTGDYRLNFHLAPPHAERGKDAGGRPLKKRFGPWMLGAFRVLAPMKRLRGTPFDPFGYTAERRMERGAGRLVRGRRRPAPRRTSARQHGGGDADRGARPRDPRLRPCQGGGGGPRPAPDRARTRRLRAHVAEERRGLTGLGLTEGKYQETDPAAALALGAPPTVERPALGAVVAGLPTMAARSAIG